MADAVPFLMFQPPKTGSAAEAMALYVSLFADGEVLTDERWGPGGPGAEGSVRLAEFVVAGQRFRCSDSPPVHDFSFTPASSIFVTCASQEELERLYAALSDGGRELMELSDYGFGPFGWVDDRFGVSWQLAGPTSR